MAGQSQPGGAVAPPSYGDSFTQNMVNNLWPGSGYAGAASSPYLNIVSPLFQSYSPMLDALSKTMQPAGPVQVAAPGPAAPGQNGKGASAETTLLKGVDPIMSATMGK